MIEKIQVTRSDNDLATKTLEAINKINEVIDWINDVSALRVTDKQVTANLPNIDAGELAFLSKENSDLKDEIKRITDILYESKYALEEVINPSVISQTQMMAQEALDKVNTEIKAITGE